MEGERSPHPTAPMWAWRAWTLGPYPQPRPAREPLLVLEWWQGHWGAGPISTGVGTMGYMLGAPSHGGDSRGHPAPCTLAPAPQPRHCRRPKDPFQGCGLPGSSRKWLLPPAVPGHRGLRSPGEMLVPPIAPSLLWSGALGPISTSSPCHWLAWRSPRRGAGTSSPWRKGEPLPGRVEDRRALGLPQGADLPKMRGAGAGRRLGDMSLANSGSASAAFPPFQSRGLDSSNQTRTSEQPMALLGARLARGSARQEDLEERTSARCRL